MLQKKLDADREEREAMKVFATKAAGVIATKAAKVRFKLYFRSILGLFPA